MPSEKSVYLPDAAVSKNSHVPTFHHYKELYQRSIDNPEEFWSEIAKEFHWEELANVDRFFVYNFDIRKGPIYTKWLDGATTNISYNLLDRNIKNGLGDKVAFYWLVVFIRELFGVLLCIRNSVNVGILIYTYLYVYIFAERCTAYKVLFSIAVLQCLLLFAN